MLLKDILKLKYIRGFFILNSITIVMVVIFYYVLIFSLGQLYNFWGLFKAPEISAKVDSIAPIRPNVYDIPQATNQSFIDITGVTEPGAKVLLFSNGNETDTAISDNDGKFIFPNVRVNNNPQNLYVKAEDRFGNISVASKSYTIVKDTEPPKLELRTFTNEVSSWQSRNDHITLEGLTTPDTTVTVNGQRAIVNLNGEFNIQYKFNQGRNVLEIIAIDRAGNSTEEIFIVNFRKQ